MARSILILIFIALLTYPVYGQQSNRLAPVYTYDNMPPLKLVDCPTAATLPRASFDFAMRTTSNGGLITRTAVGLHRRVMIGVSYGGEQVLGEGKVDWFDEIAFQLKYQLIYETLLTPALAFGFDSQGSGRYFTDLKRFMYKSKGVYAVASKGYQTYEWASGLHAGIYYSLESDVDNDDDVSFFFGADISLQNDLLFVAEYDLAMSDNKEMEHSGKGWGYLNVGLRWIFSDRLELGIDLQNLLDNRQDTNSFTRGLRITYWESF